MLKICLLIEKIFCRNIFTREKVIQHKSDFIIKKKISLNVELDFLELLFYCVIKIIYKWYTNRIIFSTKI